MARKTEDPAHLDAMIKRLKTRLKRTMTMLDKLEKKRRRIATKAAVAAVIDPMIAALKPGPITIEVTRHPAPMFDGPTEKVVVFEPDNVAGFHPDQSEAERVRRGAVDVLQPVERVVDHDSGIPEFLRRGQAAQAAADKVIADSIREEQAAKKKAKASGRIAKMKAKQSGETKKMPLSGKAALDAIRNG
jgi:hypothetical protein